MAEFRISVDLSGIANVNSAIVGEALPLLSQAVRAVAQATQSNWIQAVHRAKLWSGEKDAYAASIQWRETGPFSALVWTDYKHAEEIETGRPARDLKVMLNTSMKVRVNNKGSRYLIIPFRHNANTVPPMATQMSLSSIIGHGRRESGTGAWSMQTKSPYTVRQRKYNWGDRLEGPDVAKNQQGMVRMNTATGAKKSSAYLTFRVMSEKSTGWIIPPQPGQHIAKGVAEQMQPLAEAAFTEAIRRSAG